MASSVTVPAVFSPCEIVVSASAKKMRTFFVTDQASQLFPVHTLASDGASESSGALGDLSRWEVPVSTG